MDTNYVRELTTHIRADCDAIDAEVGALPEPPTPRPPVVLHPGDDVRQAIADAEPGAVFAFIPGQRYVTGTLYLTDKPVTLKCAEPVPQRRIGPDDAWCLPTLASGGLEPTIDGTNARGVVLSGLNFESRSDGLSEVLIFQDAVGVLMDRLLLVAGEQGQKRAIRGNGQQIVLRRSHLANIWREGQDSQAFCAWDGAGPYAIVDNYLEAAGENVMFGGSDSLSADRMPSNIVIERNTFTKRDEWKNRQNYYTVKNLFELKVGRHVRIRRNLFSGNWTDAQNGYAILIKSVNQDGGAPWSVTEDVIVEYNTVNHSENGFNINGVNEQTGGQTTGVVIRHNDITVDGVAFQVGSDVGSLVIEQNTIRNAYTFLSMYGGDDGFAIGDFTIRNNIGNHNDYGVKGDGTGVGQPSLDRWVQLLDWSDNVLNGCSGYPYPPTTYNALDDVPDGVIIGSDPEAQSHTRKRKRR